MGPSQKSAYPRKLNFGCGYDKRQNYLNVDTDPACNPDILLTKPLGGMLPTNYFEEIVARDVLEHIPRREILSTLIAWGSLLIPAGRLELQTSHVVRAAERLASFKTFAEQNGWTGCIFGNQQHPGDFHFVGFTEMTLAVHLHAAGFAVQSMSVHDHWLLTVSAVKERDETAPAAYHDALAASAQELGF